MQEEYVYISAYGIAMVYAQLLDGQASRELKALVEAIKPRVNPIVLTLPKEKVIKSVKACLAPKEALRVLINFITSEEEYKSIISDATLNQLQKLILIFTLENTLNVHEPTAWSKRSSN